MYYLLIENDQITSILNYQPEVPDTIKIIEITDVQYTDLTENKTHYFDIASESVKQYSQDKIDNDNLLKEQEVLNSEKREFLNNSDWLVLRHIREKALNLETSLTEEQYLNLENQRMVAAKAIVNPINN